MALFRIFFLLIISFQLSCSGNVLREFADKEDEDAILYTVYRHQAKKEYADALTAFQTLKSTTQAKRDNQFLLATIYLGICGLDFLSLTTEFGNIGTTNFLQFLMATFTGATATQLANCKSAETTLINIDPDAANRTTDENVLMVYTSFAKIGSSLNFYADTDNNDTVDGSFAACTTGSLADLEAGHVATGLRNFIDSMNQVASEIGVGSGSLADLNSVCSSLPGSANFCTVTDPSTLTADQQRGIRTVIRESSAIGIAECTGDVSTCLCP